MSGILRTALIALAMALIAGAAGAHNVRDAGQPGRIKDVTRTVKVVADDTGYSLKEIDVRSGETVRFIVTNAGKIDHEFSVATRAEHFAHRKMMAEMPDMKHNDPNMVTLKPGQTKILIWKFGAPRHDLEFACDIPGHAEAGMQGKFVFSP